jgi:hypothetical protein
MKLMACGQNGILDIIDVASRKMKASYMRQPRSNRRPLFAATVVAAMFATGPSKEELLEKSKTVSCTTVRYKVVLPSGYDPA